MSRPKIIFISLLAITAGLIYFLFYYFIFKNLSLSGEIFYSITPSSELYMHAFWPRVREIFDGYTIVSDPHVFEYRLNVPSPHPSLNPIIYFVFLNIFGFIWGPVFGTSFLAAASFVFLFIIFYLLSSRYLLSAFFAFFLIMVRKIPFLFAFSSHAKPIKDLLYTFLPFQPYNNGKIDRLDFLPKESYDPGFLIFGPFLIFLLLFIKKQKPLYIIMLGIFYGLLFYTYTYFWIFTTASLGTLGFFYLILKKFKEFKKLLLSVLIGLAVSSSFWISYFQLRSLSFYQDIIERTGGVEIGHQFRWSQWKWYIFYIISGIAIYLWAKKKKKMYAAYFILPMLFAGFVTLNMQVITGLNIQPDHWHVRIMHLVIACVFIVFFAWIIENLEKKKKVYKYWIKIILIILLAFQISGGIHTAYLKAGMQAQYYGLSGSTEELLEWLNKNTKKDDVVLALSKETNLLISFYTHNRIFMPPGFGSIIPQDEIVERVLAIHKIFKVSPETLNFMLSNEADVKAPALKDPKDKKQYRLSTYAFAEFYRNKNIDSYFGVPGNGRAMPPELRKETIVKYENYKISLENIEDKFRADYIYVGPYEQKISFADFHKNKNLNLVYNKGNIKIYQLLKK